MNIIQSQKVSSKKRASFQLDLSSEQKNNAVEDQSSSISKKGKNKTFINNLKKQNRLNSLKSTHRRSLFKKETKRESKKLAFYNVISSFYLTKKFISILRNLTSFRKPKWLKELHFNMMNDLSFDYNSYQCIVKEEKLKHSKPKPKTFKNKIMKPYYKKFKRFMTKLINFLPIFDPNKRFSIICDIFNIIAMCFYFIMIPLEITFGLFDTITLLNIIKTFFQYILIFDIFKSCLSSYYHKGVLMKDHGKILANYVKRQFLIDFLTLIPILLNQLFLENIEEINLYSDYWYIEFLQLLFFLKFTRFSDITKKLGELVCIDATIQSLVSLIKLIFRIVLLAHIFACIWYLIGKNSFFPQDNWILHNDLSDSEWWVQYLYSYYFVCVTMNTVGFGDVTPQNPLEVFFVIVFIFVACGIFAYSLNSIGIIVGEIWKRQNEFTKDLNLINQFMREKNINFELKMRVRKYLEYIWNEEKLEEVEEQVKYLFIFN